MACWNYVVMCEHEGMLFRDSKPDVTYDNSLGRNAAIKWMKEYHANLYHTCCASSFIFIYSSVCVFVKWFWKMLCVNDEEVPLFSIWII